MNKEFQWDDRLVKEFLAQFGLPPVSDPSKYIDRNMDAFKASHTTEVNRDWQIESFWCEATNEYHSLHLNGLYTSKKTRGGYACDLTTAINNPNLSIYCVRRLSDGELFKVGNDVDTIYWGSQIITGFSIESDGMIVDFESCRNPLNSISKPIQRTPDSIKPPIGIMPEYIWKEQRLYELNQAIIRYINAGLSYPKEWGFERETLINETNPKQ